MDTPVPLSGRAAEAMRNNKRILDAARAVFLANPEAPISAVAERAGVGISALYRRYPSKEDLLRTLCADGLGVYIAEAESALADEGDAWATFTRFMQRIVDADTHSMTLRLAGTFTPNEELNRNAQRAQKLNTRLLERVQRTAVLRQDLKAEDLALVFEQIAAIRIGNGERTRELRQRYLALVLDGIHSPSKTPLPGQPPTWDEIGERWHTDRD